jgi:hypothetical protein
MTYLILFAGWVLHLISKLIDGKITPLQWVKIPKNYMYVAFSALSLIMLAFIIHFDKLPDFDLYLFTVDGGYATAAVVGWLNSSLLRAVINKFSIKPKKVK